MKQVCDKYGALLILDEVMCGLGRTGTYHAWQHPDIGVTPDLQTVGKTLGGGYIPIAALLIGTKVASSMEEQRELASPRVETSPVHPADRATQVFCPWLYVRRPPGCKRSGALRAGHNLRRMPRRKRPLARRANVEQT